MSLRGVTGGGLLPFYLHQRRPRLPPSEAAVAAYRNKQQRVAEYLVAGHPSADCLFACIVSPGISEGAYDSRFRHAF